MHTIKLHIEDKVFDKIMYFLNRLYFFSLSTDSKKHNHAFENSRGQ